MNRYSSRLTRRKFLGSAVVGGAGLTGLLIVVCGDWDESTGSGPSSAGQLPVRGGVLRTSTRASVSTWDPYPVVDIGAEWAGAYVYSKLVQVRGVPLHEFPAQDVVPDVAESYEIAEPTKYVFTLNPKAKWHPPISRQLVAQDVVAAFERYRDIAPDRLQLGMVERVEAPNSQTVVFTLNRPFGLFLLRLGDDSTLLLLPPEVGTAYNPANAAVGSGPFRLTAFSPSGHTFTRYEEWHLADDTPSGAPPRPYLDAVQYSVIPEYANQVNQFIARNLDNLIQVRPNDFSAIKQAIPDVVIAGLTNPFWTYICFPDVTTPGASPFSDLRVRKALSMAIPRQQIFDAIYQPDLLRSLDIKPPPFRPHTVMPSGFANVGLWLSPEEMPTDVRESFEYNPDKARALLQQAGYAKGVEYPYVYSSVYGAGYVTDAELTVQAIRRAGFNLQAELVDYRSDFLPNVFTGGPKGRIALGYQGFPYPEDYLLSMYTAGNPRNHSRVNDPELERKFDALYATLDPEERRTRLRDLQLEMARKLYYVPGVLDSGPRYNISQPNVHGWTEHLLSRNGPALQDSFTWKS